MKPLSRERGEAGCLRTIGSQPGERPCGNARAGARSGGRGEGKNEAAELKSAFAFRRGSTSGSNGKNTLRASPHPPYGHLLPQAGEGRIHSNSTSQSTSQSQSNSQSDSQSNSNNQSQSNTTPTTNYELPSTNTRTNRGSTPHEVPPLRRRVFITSR